MCTCINSVHSKLQSNSKQLLPCGEDDYFGWKGGQPLQILGWENLRKISLNYIDINICSLALKRKNKYIFLVSYWWALAGASLLPAPLSSLAGCSSDKFFPYTHLPNAIVKLQQFEPHLAEPIHPITQVFQTPVLDNLLTSIGILVCLE